MTASRSIYPVLVLLGLLLCMSFSWAGAHPAFAAGQASLTLSASPDIVYADGKSDTMVTASVWDSTGSPAPDGTLVQFTSSAGTLTQDTATTLAGVARVRLISTDQADEADLTATAFIASSGGATGTAVVEFTKDKEVVASGRDARWIQINCPQYLIYSADGRIVEADGSNGSAHLQFRNLSITADSLQLDLHTMVLLARNAVLKRGHHHLNAPLLRYHLITGKGTAVATNAQQVTQTVNVSGPDFATTVMNTDAAQYTTNIDIYRFVDLYGSRMVLSARSISIDPGKSLQFQHATIYALGRKTLSLPYDVMSANSSQPLGQQAFGFDSNGLAMNVPFYYHVSPNSVGAIYFRDSVMGSGSGGGPLDMSGTRPGFAIDLRQSYQMGMHGSGQFLINSMTRSDWGAHWNDTQNFGHQTHGYFLFDSPDHRSMYASSNLTHQFSGFSLDTTASGNRDPGINGYSSASDSLNTSLATNPRRLGHSGINLVSSLAWQWGQYKQAAPGLAAQNTPVSTQTLSMRFFSQPIHLGGAALTNSMTLGESWGSGRTSPTMLLNLGMNKATPFNGQLSMNYTWNYDPLYSQLGAQPAGGLLGNFYNPSEQRLSLNFMAQPNSRLSMSLSGGYGLPFNDSNLYSNIAYQINPLWGIGVGEFFDRYLGDNYQEMEFSVSRRILGRNFTLIYSTLTRKFQFQFIGTTF